MASLDPCIPLPFDEDVLKNVISKAKDWAIMHGAAMRSKDAFSEDSLAVCSHFFIYLKISLSKQQQFFSSISL